MSKLLDLRITQSGGDRPFTTRARPHMSEDKLPVRRSFAADAITVGGSRIVNRLCTFATGVLIARLLGPEGRGLLAALSVPAALSVSLAELGVRQSTAYHVGRKTFPIERVTGALMGMLPVAALLAVLLSLGYFDVANVAEGNWHLQLAAVAVIPFGIGITYISGVLMGRGKIVSFSRVAWVPPMIALAFVATSIGIFGWGVEGALLATASGSAVGFGYALHLLRREGPIRPRIDFPLVRAIQRLGAVYAVATFALLLNYKIMILLLSRVGTLEDVGHYAIAASIAEMLWEVPQMVGALLFSRAVGAEDRAVMSAKILTFARLAVTAVALVAIALAVIAQWLFPFVYGPGFTESALACVLLLPGVVAFVLFRILQTDIHARGKAWVSIAVIAPTIVLNVGLGYWMIGGYGLMGAAMASSLTYILATIAYVIAYSRVTGIPLLEMVRYRRSDLDQLTKAIPERVMKRFRRS